MLKPCIQCEKECEIFPIQLGDIFTLTLLRVCSAECMFLIAYEFMREEFTHKSFRNWLYNKQDKEDKFEKDEYIKEITDMSLKMMQDRIKWKKEEINRLKDQLKETVYDLEKLEND